jgi:hypothetical protein
MVSLRRTNRYPASNFIWQLEEIEKTDAKKKGKENEREREREKERIKIGSSRKE